MFGSNTCSSNTNGVNSYSNTNAAASTASAAYKETQHISPHIAAHKSLNSSPSVNTSQGFPSSLVNLSTAAPVCGSSATMLTPISSHDVMTYKIVSTSNAHASQVELHPTYTMRPAAVTTTQQYTSAYRKDGTNSNNSYIQPSSVVNSTSVNLHKEASINSYIPGTIIAHPTSARTTLTNLSRVVPEDLSSTSSASMSSDIKMHNTQHQLQHQDSSPSTIHTIQTSGVISSQYLSNSSSQKPLPHIYTVAGQVPSSLFPNILDKSGTAYFRAPDVNLVGQPQAILVSGLVACDPSLDQQNNLSSLPPTTLVGEVRYDILAKMVACVCIIYYHIVIFACCNYIL